LLNCSRITDYIDKQAIEWVVGSVAAIFIVLSFFRGFRDNTRIKNLLAKYPNAEKTSVFLPSEGDYSFVPRWILDDKINEMAVAGWLYLNMTCTSGRFPDNPGVTLYFIRPTTGKNDSAPSNAG